MSYICITPKSDGQAKVRWLRQSPMVCRAKVRCVWIYLCYVTSWLHVGLWCHRSYMYLFRGVISKASARERSPKTKLWCGYREFWRAQVCRLASTRSVEHAWDCRSRMVVDFEYIAAMTSPCRNVTKYFFFITLDLILKPSGFGVSHHRT